MPGDDLTILNLKDPQERIADELESSLGGERQRKSRRFVLAALGSLPWIGGLLSAQAAIEAEAEQGRVNELHKEWLAEHRDKLHEVADTLLEIVNRLHALGPEIEARIQSDDYLALVRKAFRVWDQADTGQKRNLIKNLLMNAGGTPITADDVVRLFIQWIDFYHETHFAVIRAIYQNPGATRSDIWEQLKGIPVREDSAEADLFKMLVRDLSTGGVIRQHRETTYDGSFVKKAAVRVPKGHATRTTKSAFDDTEKYVLTALGGQFVSYTMNELVPRIGTEAV